MTAMGAIEARAQQTAVVEQPRDKANVELLARPVTVHLDHVPLRQAVLAVASAAHVRLLFRTELLSVGTVTLEATQRPLGEVFGEVLSGAQLQAVPVGPDVVSIEPTQGVSRAHLVGTVTGVVTDAVTKRPVMNATVRVDGTKIAVQTKDDGTFRLTGMSAGTYKVVVRRIGYRVHSESVEVTDGASVTLRIALVSVPTALTEVVTTATGERQRLEVGNAVGTIKADSVVATTLIRNVSDLLQARVPGVVVSNTDGAVGAPSKIRLRGVNSLALNNDPIIILDGVRLNAQSTVADNQTNVGSQQMLPALGVRANVDRAQLAPSRLDDIDPNTIESIDVLRGPSASSLYGTDAANGVIVIKTKKGKAGSWHLNLLGDNGWSTIPGRMPDMWWGFGRGQGNSVGTTGGCMLAIGTGATVVGGTCVQDSVREFNPQNDPQMRTLGTGTARSIAGNLSGGSQQLQQFLSMRVASDVGMAKMSEVEQRAIARLWQTPAPSWMVRPNTEQDIDGSSSTMAHVSSTADVSLNASGVYRNVLNGGSGLDVGNGIYQGASPSDTLGFLPSESQRTKVTSLTKRGMLAVNANYLPLSWLTFNGTGGGDYTLRTDDADLRAQDCTSALQLLNPVINGAPLPCPSGHTDRRGETFVTTANARAQLSFSPLAWITLRTSLGEQYSHTNFYSLQVGNSNPLGCPLAFGSTLLSPTPVCLSNTQQQFTVAESRDEAATAGWYIEEWIGVFGLYTSLGIRQDVASAFGGQVNKSPPNYPKFNFSYPLSEQSFFPKQSLVSSLRLRLAYGQSGNQASQTSVLNSYNLDRKTTESSNVTVMLLNQLGNPDLRPERGTEWEGGFDVSFLESERIHAEVTLYRKFTRDAIVLLALPPSYGIQNLQEYVNLGNVQNRGVEVSLRTKLFDSRQFGWDLTVNASQNANKLVHKAASLSSTGPLLTEFHEGYPLYGYWGAPVESYADRNGDGILAQSEIVFGPQKFMGAPYPKSELTYSSSLAFFNSALSVNVSFDQINGLANQLVIDQNGSNNTRGAVDRTASLAEQAGWIQAVVNNSSYLGETSSIRFNELSVTYNLPLKIAQRLLHAQSLALTVAGRNLAFWSSYAGKDPNVDTSSLFGDATQDNGTGVPQPRNWTMRFNLGL